MPLFSKTKKPASLEGFKFDIIVDYGKGNYEYSIPYGDIVTFENDRVGNTGNKFSLSIVGNLSIELEYKILSGNKKIYFSYGWEGSSPRTFIGEVLTADIKFEGMAIAFNVTGVVSVPTADTTPRSCIWTKGTKFDKILDLICTAHNWVKGFTVDAMPLSEDVVQANMTDSKFLIEELSTKLRTKDSGISDYALWFTYDGTKTILNYSPLCYAPGNDGVDRTYVYDVYGSTNTRLLSFEVENTGAVAYGVGSSLSSSAMDPDTGALVYEDTSTVESSMQDLQKAAGYLAGVEPIFKNLNNAGSLITNLKGEAGKAVAYYWQKMYASAFTAKASLFGDPFIDIGTQIQVIVLLEGGKAHYTSGTYNVTSAKDVIDTSGFKTEVDLVKYIKAGL